MAQHTNALDSRTAQIRQEIARTRLDLDRKLDALESRFAPRVLAAEAWTKARQSSSAGASRAWEKVRAHPLPSAMIVAAVGWLIYEIRSPSRPRIRVHAKAPIAKRAREGVWRTLSERPIATGLGVLAAGIAAGLSAPATAPEDEWMGETRDQLLQATKAAARDALEEGRRVVDEAIDAARGEVQRAAR
jgi:hypothetical protein